MNPALRTGLILCFAVATAAAMNLQLGAVNLPFTAVLQGLQSGHENYFIVHELRLPRLLLALIVGASLALAGVLVQGVIRNPLASPDLLGVSQGASLAAVILIALYPEVSSLWLPVVSLLGALGAALILWLLCGRHASPIKIAITGVALAAFYASTIDFVMLTRPQNLNDALLWLTGSLWGRSWEQLWLVLPAVALMPLAVGLCQRLNLNNLGDDYATTLGSAVPQARFMALALAVGLTAASVAVCGPIGFIGLMAPHLARRLVGGRHQRLIPVAMLTGALLLLLADLATRIIKPPIELPAGIMTAILGGPYFIYLLKKVR